MSGQLVKTVGQASRAGGAVVPYTVGWGRGNGESLAPAL